MRALPCKIQLISAVALALLACGNGSESNNAEAPQPSTELNCSGLYGTEKSVDNSYGSVPFGCWIDQNGNPARSGSDDCVPGCLADLRRSGRCTNVQSGKSCEEQIVWFVADAGRFGCLTQVRVKNPANERSAIAIAVDYGPNCTLERRAGRPLLGMSGRLAAYLFDVPPHASETVEVSVVPGNVARGPEGL